MSFPHNWLFCLTLIYWIIHFLHWFEKLPSSNKLSNMVGSFPDSTLFHKSIHTCTVQIPVTWRKSPSYSFRSVLNGLLHLPHLTNRLSQTSRNIVSDGGQLWERVITTGKAWRQRLGIEGLFLDVGAGYIGVFGWWKTIIYVLFLDRVSINKCLKTDLLEF